MIQMVLLSLPHFIDILKKLFINCEMKSKSSKAGKFMSEIVKASDCIL